MSRRTAVILFKLGSCEWKEDNKGNGFALAIVQYFGRIASNK